MSTIPVETKAQTFQHRSFLSERNQNVLLWAHIIGTKAERFNLFQNESFLSWKNVGLILLIYALLLVQRLAVQSLKALDFGKYGPLVDFFHGIKLHQPVGNRYCTITCLPYLYPHNTRNNMTPQHPPSTSRHGQNYLPGTWLPPTGYRPPLPFLYA
jgi:hypothetical protein